MVVPITGRVPDPASFENAGDREAGTRALEYMDLEPDTPMEEIAIDKVFLGSCTNARIEDLRAAASVIEGRKVKDNVHAMVVPGSYAVKIQAEEEGIAGIFKDAGFDWREAGCSMCLGMNPDILQPGERCASTSNRRTKSGCDANDGWIRLIATSRSTTSWCARQTVANAPRPISSRSS